MWLFRKTPLAWKNLTHDWRRLAVAVAGIGFAVLLMFTQMGFQNALFDSQVKMIDDLQGDIFVVSRAKYTLAAQKRFPAELINQARSAPGVREAYPLYSELLLSRLKNLTSGGSGKAFPIHTIGIPLDEKIFKSIEVKRQLPRLWAPASALIDVRSKAEYFDFPMNDVQALAAAGAELNDMRLQLVGVFHMGTDFAHDGNLLMSAQNFARYFPERVPGGDPLSIVDLGIVHVASGADVEQVRQSIDSLLDDQVFVFSRDQFRRREVQFWDESMPIGIVFAAGKIIGFIVGMVICYQVIYTDIADHMPEFATLKAMGYRSSYFLRLIFTEAVLLSVIGFIPGMLVSGLYGVLANSTGLLLDMTLQTIALVFALTLFMCLASGMLAVRKLLAADPATLY